MNRAKNQLTKQRIKSMRKEVRLAQAIAPSRSKAERLPAKEELKSHPKASLEKIQKSLRIKKLKRTTKVSKRTTTGEPYVESAPKHLHIEGERWMKTLIKQNVLKNKRLTKRLSKK